MRSHAYKWRGFTLMEMLVVLAILGILAAAAHPMLALSKRRQQEVELRTALRTLRTAIDAYKQLSTDGHVVLNVGDSGYPENLTVLVDGVVDARDPTLRKKIYLVRRLPRDPFADPSIPADQTWGLRSYDSPPDAPAPGKDVFDVHSLSDGVGLDGIPYGDW